MPYCCLVIDVTMSCVFDYSLNIPLCLHVWKWTSSVALFLVWNSIQKREQLNIRELDVVIAMCTRIWFPCTVILHPSMNFWWNFVLKLHPLHMLNLISSVDPLLNVQLNRECNQTSNYLGVLIFVVFDQLAQYCYLHVWTSDQILCWNSLIYMCGNRLQMLVHCNMEKRQCNWAFN